MTLTIILGVTTFLASIWGVWQAIKDTKAGDILVKILLFPLQGILFPFVWGLFWLRKDYRKWADKHINYDWDKDF